MKPEQFAHLAAANNTFALDLYARLRGAAGNIVFSPISLESALAMTWSGANGQTAEQMAAVLHLARAGDRAQVGVAFSSLLNYLNGQDYESRPYQLSIANALWGQQRYAFNAEYLREVKEHYDAALTPLDFAQTESARQTINAYIAGRTNDKIKELIAPGMLSAISRLVLTNAVYFKAAWQDPFKPRFTRDEDFFVAPDKPVQKPMMHGYEMRLNLYQDSAMQAVMLPYSNGGASMVVILPRAKDGLSSVEKSLSVGTMQKLFSQWRPALVNVGLPKFKSTQGLALRPVLEAMGMPLAFLPEQADFSRIVSDEPLVISEVIHQAMIDVNEAGTEAAAATAVLTRAGSAPKREEPVQFVADHPFLYFLIDNRSGIVLFMGRVVNPTL